MSEKQSPARLIAQRGSKEDIEHGSSFAPKFDQNGLIAAIAADALTGEVLMLAWMNEDALTCTIKTGVAHFWSRSRNELWRKGQTSGNELKIVEMRTDCDQDAILMRVRVAGNGLACHTGAKSCFYRTVPTGISETYAGPLTLLSVTSDRDIQK